MKVGFKRGIEEVIQTFRTDLRAFIINVITSNVEE